MIIRRQFRGCFREQISSNSDFRQAVILAEEESIKLIKEKVLLQVSLFFHETMCFLYYEAINEDPGPEVFLQSFDPYMEFWPEEEGKKPWAPMYCVYYHSIPQNEGQWEGNRSEKKRIGRIAFLYPNQVAEYVCWHKRIMKEGLFKGDQYQFISLHENMLFSYFEEPQKLVNIQNLEEESMVIQEYRKSKPERYFNREKAQGNNFLVLPKLFSVGRSDLL